MTPDGRAGQPITGAIDAGGAVDLDAARAQRARHPSSHHATATPLPVDVPPGLAPHLAALYRTEDLAVAPDGRRAVVPSFFGDFMVVADLDVVDDGEGPRLVVSNPSVVQCDALRNPHGIAFVDENTVLVANRGSELMLITLPRRGADPMCVTRSARVVVGNHDPVPVRSPGSVAVRVADGLCEAWVCNNAGHDVTRHLLDLADGGRVLDREVVVTGLATPDGIALDATGDRIAISNHDTHEVLIFAREPGAIGGCGATTQIGVARGANYPHGLAFADDDRALLVADAGLPYLYVFAATDGDWAGERSPVGVHRVMDDATFDAGRYNPQEGGPKGLAVLHRQRAVVLTSTFHRFCCLRLADLSLPGPVTPAGSPPDVGASPPEGSARPDWAAAIVRRDAERIRGLEATVASLSHRNDSLAAELVEATDERDATAEALDAMRGDLERLAGAVDELRNRVVESNRSVTAAEAARSDAARRLAAIEASTAWRVSAPFRAVLDAVRGRRRGR